MTQIIASLAEISGRYDALFCDLWGCLHNGVAPFPQAVAALQQYRATGKQVVLVTNAPRPSSAVIEQLARIGVPEDAWDLVVSSGDASRAAMIRGAVGQKVYHLGPDKDASFFTDTSDGLDASGIERVELDDAEGVVCTGLFDDRCETPEDYRPTLLFAKTRGLKLLCTNPDIVVDMGDTRVYCAGAIAQLYEEMGGEAIYCGKPHPPIYDLARARLVTSGYAPSNDILCLGDGLLTDVKGGIGEGLDTLFITGGIAASEFGPDPEQPDPAMLDAWLARHELSPTYAIPALR
ncbi:TIGR01459 family HAD-type hydrolase [Frigidibacter sp. ROC022]|uniref:TIGR01459 family HAD-type hydrolase n=1 Tax=Frigidibacter sp. ROC022 TaxID=2971796 RepID=UPI00215B5471|nr:TIGR01459 family HAD-type hydrolase [Frigidibacter sp. ROC022]MCR8722944.1 TIGR01459 family HAD-type hydrolase [Frigidibacter sp. ROC022]